MFLAYIDDSGTAPDQRVAMATALVMATQRIAAFESEWATFINKWGISDFHTSECAAANRKSCFADWDKVKIDGVFKRVRQIIRKYGARAISLSVHKSDYDELIPGENRPTFGDFHYTYAIHNILAMLDSWASRGEVQYPIDFVFDSMNTHKTQMREIRGSLERSEKARPGRFAGHYFFRSRKEVPGLQCVDLIGWTCCRYSLNVHYKTPLTELQRECWQDFSNWKNGEWLTSAGQTREEIRDAVAALRKTDQTKPLQTRPYIIGEPDLSRRP